MAFVGVLSSVGPAGAQEPEVEPTVKTGSEPTPVEVRNAAQAGSPDRPGFTARQAHPTIGVEEIERGQTGYGLSVFAGTEPERFELEVVGVLRNLNPGTSFILAELSGHGLEQSGVAGGMSGSPVYIDGRLAGAVSFSWNFGNGALAGITPIATMRQLRQAGGGESRPRVLARAAGSFEMSNLLQRGNGRERLEEALHQLPIPFARPALEDARFGLQVVTSGFSGGAAQLIHDQFAARGVAAGGGGQASQALAVPPLAAGSTVIGVLVGGDLQMAVSGTVTERQGDEVLAFGHPFLGIGALQIPMAEGEVVTVVSSKMSSFKLTNTGRVVGAFEQDLLPGVRGRIGPAPATTPMTVRVLGSSPPEERIFRLELADLPAMRPGLIGVSLLQSLEAAARSAGEQSVDMRARITLDGYAPLQLEQSFDGTGAAFDAAVYVLQVSGFLELNPWVDVDVTAIDVDLAVAEERLRQEIVDAFPARRTVRPGEALTVHLELEAIRGARSRSQIEVSIPDDVKPGPYYLFVGDGVSTDAVKLKVAPQAAGSFVETLEQLQQFHSARDLVVLGVRAGRGLTFDGRVLSDLPASVRALWSTARRTEIQRTSLVLVDERVKRWSAPLSGISRIDLVVVEDGGSEIDRPEESSEPAGSASEDVANVPQSGAPRASGWFLGGPGL